MYRMRLFINCLICSWIHSFSNFLSNDSSVFKNVSSTASWWLLMKNSWSNNDFFTKSINDYASYSLDSMLFLKAWTFFFVMISISFLSWRIMCCTSIRKQRRVTSHILIEMLIESLRKSLFSFDSCVNKMTFLKLFNFDVFWSSCERNSYQNSTESFCWLESEKDLKWQNDVCSMMLCVFTLEMRTSSSIIWLDFVRRIIL